MSIYETTAHLSHSASNPALGEIGVTAVDVSAEARVLSAIFNDPALVDDVIENLTDEHFGVPAHQAIWRAVAACDSAGRAIDPTVIADELSRSGELPRIGGVDGLREALSAPPATLEFADLVQVIVQRSLRRRVVSAAREMAQVANTPTAPVEEVIETAERVVMELTSSTEESSSNSMAQVVAKVHERMTKVASGQMFGTSTGIPSLDEITGGFEPGQLVIVAGRPGSGKSVLSTQISRHISEVSGLVVPFMSYEMTAADIGMRILASMSDVSLTDLRAGRVPPARQRQLAQAASKMANLPLLIDDRPPPRMSGLRSHVRRLSKRAPLAALTVDYLQLMGAEVGVREDNRAFVVGNISRGLKLLGDELQVPVIACSQLNRGSVGRDGGRPMLSDLRESGSLEQDASIVILVHRPALSDPDADPNVAELIVAKNRNGEAPKTIEVTWQGQFSRFVENPGHGGGRAPEPAGDPDARWYADAEPHQAFDPLDV